MKSTKNHIFPFAKDIRLYLSRLMVHSQPKPALIFFGKDKTPHFIQFYFLYVIKENYTKLDFMCSLSLANIFQIDRAYFTSIVAILSPVVYFYSVFIQQVYCITEKNQPTGALTRGHVERILTESANHPHGTKVMLVEGEQVGRVKRCSVKYKNIVPAVFIARPNRFITHCEIDGNTEACHVKDTGCCNELLIPGVDVYSGFFW